MENINIIVIAEKLITNEFAFLEQDGYEKKCEIINGETFIEYMRIEYRNVQKKRKVSIGYTKGKVYDDIKYSFGVSIIRIPYSDVEDFFALDVFLDSINEDFSTSLVNHFDEKKAKEIVIKLTDAVKYYAGDLISGEKWLDDYWARW